MCVENIAFLAYYSTNFIAVLNFLRFKWYVVGPTRYFDFKFCFFFIKTVEFWRNLETEPSNRGTNLLTRIIIPLQTSPFLLNLNLNPLYSTRGGSRTLAEPLIKNPRVETLRWNPLYK